MNIMGREYSHKQLFVYGAVGVVALALCAVMARGKKPAAPVSAQVNVMNIDDDGSMVKGDKAAAKVASAAAAPSTSDVASGDSDAAAPTAQMDASAAPAEAAAVPDGIDTASAGDAQVTLPAAPAAPANVKRYAVADGSLGGMIPVEKYKKPADAPAGSTRRLEPGTQPPPAEDQAKADDMDPLESVLRELSGKGDVKAMVDLADLLAKRKKGTPQERLALLEKAAQGGSVKGMILVAELYATGDGVPANTETGYAWLTLAQAFGAKTAIDKRAALSNSMSELDLKAGQFMAEKFLRDMTPEARKFAKSNADV